MDNEKKMVDMAAEIVENLLEAKTAGKMPGNVVHLDMTPEKIPTFAKLFPREMVEKSVGTFIHLLAKTISCDLKGEQYDWDDDEEDDL